MLFYPALVLGWVLFSPVARELSDPSSPTSYEKTVPGRNKEWEHPGSFDLDEVAMRWSLPPSAYDNEGLGGGISYALHKDFCDRMDGLFPEAHNAFAQLFISCELLRHCIKRAMDTWAINHKNINFKDVTEDCAEEESTEKCAAAELFIVPEDQQSNKQGDLAAWVDPDYDDIDFSPWTTSGIQLSNGIGMRRAKMTIRAPSDPGEFCWYLDPSFCHWFHKWNEGFDLVTFGRVVFAIIFGVAIVFTLYIFWEVYHATFQDTDDPPELQKTASEMPKSGGENPKEDLFFGSRRCTKLLDYVAVMPMYSLLFAIFWIVLCPSFYFRIFLPCWDCYDFEATIAHEIGHVLGFHHPDALWQLNLNANRSMKSCAIDGWPPSTVGCGADLTSFPTPGSCCQHPFQHIHLNKTDDITESIMYSSTTHQSRTCLSADDLEGLNYLYPVCSGAFDVGATTSEPICIKPQTLSGWLRFLVIVFIPFLLCSIGVIFIQTAVRHQEKKRMRSLHEMGLRLRQERNELRERLWKNARQSISKRGSVRGSVSCSKTRRSIANVLGMGKASNAPVNVTSSSAVPQSITEEPDEASAATETERLREGLATCNRQMVRMDSDGGAVFMQRTQTPLSDTERL